MFMRMGGPQRLGKSHDRIDRSVSCLGALLGRILHAELQRIHAEFLGNLVHHAFHRISADR